MKMLWINRMTVVPLLLTFLTQEGTAADTRPHNKLIVILLDGFRWDYFTDDMKGFNSLFQSGVKADFLQPVYPSVSYTNYYSIMTGLYAESHGMIDNFIYDEKQNKSFLIGMNADHLLPFWWNEAEPIWVTARKQNRNTYMYYWPGCEVEIRKVRPNYCDSYSPRHPTLPEFRIAIEQGLNVLQNNTADLVAIFFDDTDHYGHQYGPKGDVLMKTIKEVDSDLFWLQQQLHTRTMKGESHKMADRVNVVVVSDHGMTHVSPEKAIKIEDYLDMSCVKHYQPAAVHYIWPKDNCTQKVYDMLKDKHPHLKVYLKQDIPERWHVKNNDRQAPIIAVPDLGWEVLTPGNGFPGSGKHGQPLMGDHGYDNAEADMRGIFVATGPDIKRNVRVEGFINVNIYQMLCKILGLVASPHNGTWSIAEQILQRSAPKPYKFRYDWPAIKGIVIVVTIASVAMCIILAVYWVHNRRKSGFMYRLVTPSDGDL